MSKLNQVTNTVGTSNGTTVMVGFNIKADFGDYKQQFETADQLGAWMEQTPGLVLKGISLVERWEAIR